jgi:hypothetical protein
MRTQDLHPGGWLLPAAGVFLAIALFRDWLGARDALTAVLQAIADAAMWAGGLVGRGLGWLLEQLAAPLLD